MTTARPSDGERLASVGALAWKYRTIVAGLLAPVDRREVAGSGR